MSRYPDEATRRFDQQFAEDPEERNERLRRKRRQPQPTPVPAGSADAATALIARLEAAIEGSVGLDKAIAQLVGTYSAPDRGDPFGGAPFYTTSIDAALTLVPNNYAVYRLSIWAGMAAEVEVWGTHQETCTAMLKHAEYWHDAKDGRWEAKATTAPLALCIAALKARAQESGQ